MKSTAEIVVWSEAMEVLDRNIEQAMIDAANATDLREMGKAQGRLEAFRQMKALPRLLTAEATMEEADEKNREAIRRSQDPSTWAHPDLKRR